MSGSNGYWISKEQLEDWTRRYLATKDDKVAKAILKGKTWNSSDIQDMVNQLRREISGTGEWASMCGEVHKAYLEKLVQDEPTLTKSKITERSNRLPDMLERLWRNP